MYYLMNKDEKVLLFDRNLEITELYNFKQLPYQIRSQIEDNDEINILSNPNLIQNYFIDWLDLRNFTPNQNRMELNDFLETIESYVGEENILDYITYTSINDTYWFKPITSSLVYSDVNPYLKELDERISEHLSHEKQFEDYEFCELVKYPIISPEVTIGGSQVKRLYKDKFNRIYMIKYLCFEKLDDQINQIISEKLAATVLARLGFPVQSSDIVEDEYNLYLLTELFTDENTGFIPATSLFSSSYTGFDILADERVEDFRDDLEELFLAQLIIYNTDFHLGNWGFLIDNETQQIKGVAPSFDLNLSLWHDEKYVEESPNVYKINDFIANSSSLGYIEWGSIISKHKVKLEQILIELESEEFFLEATDYFCEPEHTYRIEQIRIALIERIKFLLNNYIDKQVRWS